MKFIKVIYSVVFLYTVQMMASPAELSSIYKETLPSVPTTMSAVPPLSDPAIALASAPSAANGSPINVVLATQYMANSEVLNFMKWLFSFSNPQKKPARQTVEAKDTFCRQITEAVGNLLTSVSTPNFKAYLAARDLGRKQSNNPQELTSVFSNAYSAYQTDVDVANKCWQQVLAIITSTINTEMLVSTIGENSEVTLLQRLTPFIQMIIRFFSYS